MNPHAAPEPNPIRPQPSEPASDSGRVLLRTRVGLAVFHCLALVVAFSALRLALGLFFRPETPAAPADYLRGFLTGLVRDLPVSVAFTLPWLIWVFFCPRKWFHRPWHRWLFLTAYTIGWFGQIFLLASEFFFFEEFKSRFNTVAIDYLLYPHEVFVNIWESYPVPLVIAICAALSAFITWRSQKFASEMWSIPLGSSVRRRVVGGALLVLVLLGFLVQYVPNRFSRERLVNELSNNGVLSVLNAAWSRNLDYAAFYPVMSREEAFARSRRLLAEPGSEFVAAPDSLARQIPGDTTKPKLNVVMFLEESLGSEFFGSLGRKQPTLTPRLDELSTEGLFFVNMYATGNRTVRGFEGILSSFPPLPGDSIVKRDRSDNVETIARVLRRDGYRTTFLYGGRGLFDGMRSFSVRNGYERFIEQKDFPNPTFTTIWGVCNEDLYQKTLEDCRAQHKTGQPFLATVLSVSNHKPFTFPPGRIPEDPKERQRGHAVKYTDYALGQFFDQARREPFWTNTIFVVVADHGARVYGSQSIPIHSYEIPFLVLGPSIVKQPARLPMLGSQVDVVPTILGLLGRPYQTMFYGHDLLKSPNDAGRILINHNRDIGIASGDRLVVFSLGRKTEFYQGDAKKGTLVITTKPDDTHRELEKDGIALFQTADELYMHQRYNLDPNGALPTAGAAPAAGGLTNGVAK